MAQESSSFSVEELYKKAKENGGSYLKFIDNEQLSSGIYQLKAGELDEQKPHEWDEIYYVLEGRAQLKVEDKVYDASAGAILFVAAQIQHSFINIEEDIKILVFFAKK